MTALVRHLHALVCEVRVTDAEWMQTIQFLTAVGQKRTPGRQEFILLSDTYGVSSLVLAINHPPRDGSLESAVLGPFYVDGAPERPLGADLTDGMPGMPTFDAGTVMDTRGRPLAGATLDIWSSDGAGLYDEQRPGPFQAQGRARIRTGADGRYRFRSVKPAVYPVPTDGPVGALLRAQARDAFRPGHLYLKVSAPGHAAVVTQIFVADSPDLDSDVVFGAKRALAAEFRRHPPGPAPDGSTLAEPFCTADFDLRLQPAA
jgi:hydroxyquinol 1,2-dioxygenase